MFKADALWTKSQWTMSRMFGGVAIVWTCIGFVLWYRRVQVYQDRILRKEAEQRAPRTRKQEPAD